ncbi:GNAT family N-acetyltransferase [Caenimonas koreensis]|uniref:GNAT family N-acetyltransferase n=1 Tax=Caenimonas koreensis TaxID=367474 RepID=UPI00378313F0
MKNLAPLRVETERLVLRQFTLADHEQYARICADPDVMRYVGMGTPNTPEVTWRVMAGMLGHWQMLGYGLYALTLKDGTVIGHFGFIDVMGWPSFELAYVLGRDYWGQGYAREAGVAALKVAREDLKKSRIISLIRPPNAPSIKLAKSLGATLEGTVDLMGSPAELYVYPT